MNTDQAKQWLAYMGEQLEATPDTSPEHLATVARALEETCTWERELELYLNNWSSEGSRETVEVNVILGGTSMEVGGAATRGRDAVPVFDEAYGQCDGPLSPLFAAASEAFGGEHAFLLLCAAEAWRRNTRGEVRCAV